MVRCGYTVDEMARLSADYPLLFASVVAEANQPLVEL